jgi:hypothetical protein
MSDGVTTVTGLFILWWGWISFPSGSFFGLNSGKWEFAARAGVGTTLASIASGFTALMFSMAKHKGKVSVLEVVNGVLAGLGEERILWWFGENINNFSFQSLSTAVATCSRCIQQSSLE